MRWRRRGLERNGTCVARCAAVALVALARCGFCAAPVQAQNMPVEIHYAPHEDLEAIDVRMIDDAVDSVDMAAYVLSDGPVIRALQDAADRGVSVRLYLDKGQYSQHGPARGGPIGALLATPNVFSRIKGRGVLMHLKAYVIDNKLLRTGSGNFSHPGLAQQDNDLILVSDVGAVTKFERNFESIWARGQNLAALAPRMAFGGPR